MECVDYIIEFLLGEENKEANNYISYGETDNAKIVIVPSGFFDDTHYLLKESLPSEPLKTIDGIPFLYGEDKTEYKNGKIYIYADVVASSFFLLSRYEECICREERDMHGRFFSDASLIRRNGLLKRCVVDEYGDLLRRYLGEAGVRIRTPLKRIKKVFLTHDIDHIWTWNSYYAAFRSFGKRVLQLRQDCFEPFYAVMNYKEYDPVYTFPLIQELDLAYRRKTTIPCDIIYFLMGTTNRTLFDDGYAKNMARTQDLVDNLKHNAHIGYHVSYAAKDRLSLIDSEIKNVVSFAGKEITQSRNHFLASKEPEDYEHLIKNGITDDFSMGFADCIGFRLGTCRPVRWINPISKHVTVLTLHPLTIMERTFDEYMEIENEYEAFEEIKAMILETKYHSGEITLLWHNDSFAGNTYFKSLYKNTLDYLLAIEG